MKAIERADVAVVMIDATEGYTAQDAHVVGHVLEAAKGVVLVMNKWDALEKDGHTADEWLKTLRREAPYLAWADIVFASAQTGQRVERILHEARRVAEERFRRIQSARTPRRTSATGNRRSSTPRRWRSARPPSSCSSTIPS
jgi:GTP-binding protein